LATVSARALLSLWLPPLAFMGLIFFGSAQPDLTTGLGVLDFVARKLIHAGEYALLCLLWWRALRTVTAPRPALIAAVAVAVAYATSDEFHQAFVPGRHGTPVDVAIDAFGASVAALVVWRRGARSPSAGLSATASRAA
jgi:VanZ like family